MLNKKFNSNFDNSKSNNKNNNINYIFCNYHPQDYKHDLDNSYNNERVELNYNPRNHITPQLHVYIKVIDKEVDSRIPFSEHKSQMVSIPIIIENKQYTLQMYFEQTIHYNVRILNRFVHECEFARDLVVMMDHC